MDMFQPTDPLGKHAGWNDAIAQRFENSLIRLGRDGPRSHPTPPGGRTTGFTQGLQA
jgi:hypothetical protein